MSKKVIEQEQRFGDIHIIHNSQSDVEIKQHTEWIIVQPSTRTTVAKAIDPEYQKVIDQNAKLVEALEDYEKLKWYLQNQLEKMRQLVDDGVQNDIQQMKTKITINNYKDILEALKNTKNIEG